MYIHVHVHEDAFVAGHLAAHIEKEINEPKMKRIGGFIGTELVAVAFYSQKESRRVKTSHFHAVILLFYLRCR